MTPLAPPLADDVRLLAWSQADADFWWSGRADALSTVVGSQLLWEAARAGTPVGNDGDSTAHPPVFLGQLHGAELPWRQMARTAERFCRETGAVYRPHPSERDRMSRLTHALFQRRGITVDRSGTHAEGSVDDRATGSPHPVHQRTRWGEQHEPPTRHTPLCRSRKRVEHVAGDAPELADGHDPKRRPRRGASA